jgi:hypothetical protein
MGKSNIKQDLSSLVNKVTAEKREIPIQKVVPIKKDTVKNSNMTKVSLSMNLNDWLDITRFKNFKILELKQVDYTFSDAILYGLSLLEDKYNIERNKEKIFLKRGRRPTEKISLKDTTIDLPNERALFINDFLYFKIFVKKQIEFTRPEMMEEIVRLIKIKNKEVFQ